MKKTTIGVTAAITAVGMAAGFQIASNATPVTLIPATIETENTTAVQPTPRPTITVTAHPTITAAPVQVVQEPSNSNTTVDVPVDNSASNNAPVEQPQQPVQPPAQQQPPATNTGASG